MGLSQELVEWSPTQTDRLVRIDILNLGEVINVSAAGGARNNRPRPTDELRYTILSAGGATLATHTTTGAGSPGKLDPADPMNDPIVNPWRFITPAAGEYFLAVENLTNDEIHRLDVTVTPDVLTDPDPTGQSGIVGRVSSKHWNFRAGSFDVTDATDADYFVLTPGGVPNTNYVWKLDLNQFAGFGFALRANSIGLVAPNSGFSAAFPIPDESLAPDWVPEEFDIYINYPQIARPEPVAPPSVQNFAFLDDEGVDNSISPDTSLTVQDSGVFSFNTDSQNGTYEIAIDLNGNGQFGDAGDVRLVGNTSQGANAVTWDGQDNNGGAIPYGSFTARVSVRLGEFHFVAQDAETSGGNQDGLTVFRAAPGGGETPTAVFWDDVTMIGAAAGGTANLPDGGQSGTAAGYHTWGNFIEGPIGDKQFIDTWVFGLSSQGTTGVVVADNDAPARTVATVDLTPFSVPGDTLTLTVSDPDLAGAGNLTVEIVNMDTGESESVILAENVAGNGTFSGTIATLAGGGVSNNSGTLETRPGNSLELRYRDTTTPTGTPVDLTDDDQVLGLSLTKRGTLDDGGDGRADVGDQITYSFVVTNRSDIALTNVSVTDPLVSVSGGPLANLAPGATDAATFTANYVLTQIDINAGRFENVAQATGTAAGYGQVSTVSDDPQNLTDADPDGDGIPNDPTVTSVGASASVTLLKRGALDDGSDGRADAGDHIDYVFTVTNTGNVGLTDLSITDPGTNVSGGPLLTLAPGASDTTTFTGRRTLLQADVDAGVYINSAVVSGRDPSGNLVTDQSDDPVAAGAGNADPTQIELTEQPQLTLLKSGVLDPGPDGQASIGDRISYVFAVTNTGNVTLAPVTITDPNVAIMGGEIASLAPGQTDNMTLTATYPLTQADLDRGQVTNSAVARGTSPQATVVSDRSDDAMSTAPADDDPTVTVIPSAPSITLFKTATLDDGGDGWADVGDTIDYQFRIVNTGSVSLTNITITDPGVIVVGGLLATLASGAEDAMTFTARYTLTQADLNAGRVTNSATVTARDPADAVVTAVSDDPLDPTNQDDDGDGQPSDPTVINLPVNRSPVAVDDPRVSVFDTPITLDPRDNDTDPDADPLTVSVVGLSPNGTSLINPDGTVTVAPNPGFVGVISIPYTVCDTRLNCDDAVINVTISQPLASLSGTVFLDSNLDGTFTGGEQPRPAWTVELRDAAGSLLATTTASLNGGYAFADVDLQGLMGPVSVTARHPNTGVVYRVLSGIALSPGADVTGLDLPVDPIGVVYDSINRTSISDARVTILAQSGETLPDQCFRDASQQNQMTAADGAYFFEIMSGAAAQCPAEPTAYRIALTSPVDYSPGASSLIAAETDAVDPSPGTGPFPVVAAFGAPVVGGDTTYHFDLTIGSGEREITRNNLPLDPLSLSRAPLSISKLASVNTVSVGGIVPYTVTLTNSDAYPYLGVDLVDLMPAGFTLAPNTLSIDGTPTLSSAQASGFTVQNLSLAVNQTISIDFSAVAGTGVRDGIAINRAVARSSADGRDLSAFAEASVRVVPSAEFDCAEVIGKVFDDIDRNGVQDFGETGMPGVRLATARGLLITTGPQGRYHIACAAIPNPTIGSNFILKLDPRTLPTGYRMVSENPRVIRLTRGKMSKANFATAINQLVTLDLEDGAFLPGRLELAPHIAAELPRLFAALRQREGTLRLNYHAWPGDPSGQARLDALAKYVAAGWSHEGGHSELSIERRVVFVQPNQAVMRGVSR